MRENEEFIKENLEKYGNIKIFSQFHAYLQDKKQQSRPQQSNYQLLPPVFEPTQDQNLDVNMMPPPNPSNPMPLIQKMSQNNYYMDPPKGSSYPPPKQPRFMGYNRPPPMGSMPYPAQYTPETGNKPSYYYNNNNNNNNINNNPRMNEMNPRMNPPLNQMNTMNEYSSPRGNPPPQMTPNMNPNMNPPIMNQPPQIHPNMNHPPQMNQSMNHPPQIMNPNMNQPPQILNPTMSQPPQMMNQPLQIEKRPMNYYEKYQQQPPPYGPGGSYYPQEMGHNSNMGYYHHPQDRSFSAPKLSQPTFWTEESKNPYENYPNMPKPPHNYLKPTNNYSGYFPSQPNDNMGNIGSQNQGTTTNNMGYYNSNPMRIMTNNNNNPMNNNNNNNNSQRQPMPNNVNPYMKPGYNNHSNEMPPQNLPFSSNIFPMKPNNPVQNPSNIANLYENPSNFTKKKNDYFFFRK